jgi:hypothetical protein
MACVGSIQEMKVPENVYIAGVNDEGTTTVGSPGQILYLDGPGVSFLKPGSVLRVIRPEGKVRDRLTAEKLGTYYKDIGTVRIEAVEQESATASILMTCEGMLKGDIVVPSTLKPVVEFSGSMSDGTTQLRGELTSSILIGKNDARLLAVGQFCFIQLGSRDGVKPGDRFVVFRPHPSFNSQDMNMSGSTADALYSPVRGGFFQSKMDSMLHDRILPPKILGPWVRNESDGPI